MAEDKKLKITGEIEVNTQQASEGVGQVVAELRKLNELMSAFAGAMVGSTQKLIQVTQKAGEVRAEVQGASEAAKGLESSAAAAGDALGKASEEAEGLDSAGAGAAEGLKQATKSAVQLDNEIKATDKATQATTAAAKQLGQAVKDANKSEASLTKETSAAGKEMKQAAAGAKDVDTNTKKATASAEVWKGIWQGVGQAMFRGVVGGLQSIWQGLKDTSAEVNQADMAFARLNARGLANVEELGKGVDGLSDSLHASKALLSEQSELAIEMGATEESALQALSEAWVNYRLTRMEVNETLTQSARLVKGFNLDAGEQAKIIAAVSQASTQARVSQQMLYNSMSALGPMARQLGITWRELLNVTVTGLARGIKGEEEGLKGMGELLQSLVSPSDQLRRALLELGLVGTQSSGQWLAHTQALEMLKAQFDSDQMAIRAMTAALDELNGKLRENQLASEAISVVSGEAQRRLEWYQKLADKQASGQQLSLQERREMREMERTLADYNEQLSRYDSQAGLVINAQFRHMSVAGQLAERLEAVKNVQTDLSEQSARLQHEANQLNLELEREQKAQQSVSDAMDDHKARLEELSQALSIELPGAIRLAISEQGFGAFLGALAKSKEAMAALTPATQVLVSTVGPEMQALGRSAQGTEEQVRLATEAMARLRESGAQAASEVDGVFANMRERLVRPFVEAGNEVQKEMLAWFDANKIGEQITAWSQNLAARMTGDLRAVFEGKKDLREVISGWWRDAWEWLATKWDEFLQPALDRLIDAFNKNKPKMRAFLVEMFKELGSAAMEAFTSAGKKATTSFLDDWAYQLGDGLPRVGASPAPNAGGVTANQAQVMGSLMPGALMAPVAVGGGMAQSPGVLMPSYLGSMGGGGMQLTFHNYGVSDPDAVSKRVMRDIEDAARLGIVSERVR